MFEKSQAGAKWLRIRQGGNSLGGDAAGKCITKASASPWPQSVAQSFCRQFPSLRYVCRSHLSLSALPARPLPHRGQISESFLHHRCTQLPHRSNSQDAPYNLFPAYHLQEPVVVQMTHWKANDQNGEAAFQRLILCALSLPLFPSVPR